MKSKLKRERNDEGRTNSRYKSPDIESIKAGPTPDYLSMWRLSSVLSTDFGKADFDPDEEAIVGHRLLELRARNALNSEMPSVTLTLD